LKRGCLYYFEDAHAKVSKGEFSLYEYKGFVILLFMVLDLTGFSDG
jgi:hypothetical protein